jgi:hypothetical protein
MTPDFADGMRMCLVQVLGAMARVSAKYNSEPHRWPVEVFRCLKDMAIAMAEVGVDMKTQADAAAAAAVKDKIEELVKAGKKKDGTFADDHFPNDFFDFNSDKAEIRTARHKGKYDPMPVLLERMSSVPKDTVAWGVMILGDRMGRNVLIGDGLSSPQEIADALRAAARDVEEAARKHGVDQMKDAPPRELVN